MSNWCPLVWVLYPVGYQIFAWHTGLASPRISWTDLYHLASWFSYLLLSSSLLLFLLKWMQLIVLTHNWPYCFHLPPAPYWSWYYDFSSELFLISLIQTLIFYLPIHGGRCLWFWYKFLLEGAGVIRRLGGLTPICKF